MKTVHSCNAIIICIVCIACIPSIVPAQVKDDFSDGNFTNNPSWTGDVTHFEVNYSGQLHLLSSGSDTSVLATRYLQGSDTEWSFWMKLSFNTSSNNHARIYLTADTSELTAIVNGYFLQVGGSNDSVSIMKQTGKMIKTVFRFRSYRTSHSTNTLRFKITRAESGFWQAMIDTTGGFNYFLDGTFPDTSFQPGSWIGVMCRYTSSNAAKFYFDDFYVGPVQYDTTPPAIVYFGVPTARELRLRFSEPVEKINAESPGNFKLMKGDAIPDSAMQDLHDPGIVTIYLHDSLPDGTIDSLLIRNMTDLSGNRMPDTAVNVCYYIPKSFDILINEIMADPDPPVELPDAEFAELYNRSAFSIDLQGWTFRFGNFAKIFPSMVLPSGEYLLVVKDSAYLNFARCAVLLTSSTSLSNEGTTLVLKDSQQHVIHSVDYSPEWFRGSFKEEGGWSLEMADPFNPCGCMENWWPSKDPFGGTPGRVNSILKPNPDQTAPDMLRAVITDSTVLEITFSEPMDSLSMLSQAAWTIYPGESHPVFAAPEPPLFSSARLTFNQQFLPGIVYNLKLNAGIKDCTGNLCDTSHSVRFAFPDSVVSHDIVINEILSNPASGGARFVELFNRSEKIIDLQSLVLSSRDTSAGLAAYAVPLTSGGYLLFPGDYIAFSSDRLDICSRYHPLFPEFIAGINGFPVFGDDTGTVIIARKDNFAIIDKMQYHTGMHYPLLATEEGVSLERTSPDLPSGDQSNWHSAAGTSGFATPGYRNSHWVKTDGLNEEVTVQPVIFSPDNDGRDDLLTISILENTPDCSANIAVYDSRGRLVRRLANNDLVGSEGVFIWDGITAMHTKAPLGLYVLLVELIWPEGIVRKIKKCVVLGGKF